jgi:hypothetical protein
VTCGPGVGDVVVSKSGGGHRQNVSDENGICPQKVSELIQIPGDREKVSDERRIIRQKASELIEIPGHRQKVSYETSLCQQKASELTEIHSDEIGICREKASYLIARSIPDDFNLIKSVPGMSRSPIRKPLKTHNRKRLGKRSFGKSTKEGR